MRLLLIERQARLTSGIKMRRAMVSAGLGSLRLIADSLLRDSCVKNDLDAPTTAHGPKPPRRFVFLRKFNEGASAPGVRNARDISDHMKE